MVTSIPTDTTITLQWNLTNQDLVQQHLVVLEFRHYYPVGPAEQAKVLVGHLGSWGGEEAGEFTYYINSSDINAVL